MALRILATRLVQGQQAQAGLPMRVCMASMSSSTPANPPPKAAATSSAGTVRRESIRSKLASIFGGYVDPANPNDPPIPADEVNFPDVTERATGEEKLFLLAFENGILDPYCNLPVERNGRGTKDNPVIVKGFEMERLVACSCEESQNHFKFTTLQMNEPKRCFCGHWMKLVPAPRFWEKIPKEDLVTIPWFMDLDKEGKLDHYLATGELLDENHPEKHGAHGGEGGHHH